jgi:hypothetical protein
MATIVQSNGWCPAHDPDRAEARKRSSARANGIGRDVEIKEIREGLRLLQETADAPSDATDTERVDLLLRIVKVRLYAAKCEAEVLRHAAEVRALEEYATELEVELDAIKNGH